MSSFNPLTSILNQNKLEGPNYVDWKRNLDIVQTAEGYKFVISEECPEKSENATDDQVKAYDKWVKADEMARCYILGSMANVLQISISPWGLLMICSKVSKRCSVSKIAQLRQTAMKALLNTKMAEGSSVLGAVIDKESSS
ncbi:PREDICTED: uncharacterized protein LOC109231434 [Nicotiana attenuata]|uniref:uncharacterized protein LOC109231434 n=1 Tax=Nicotiana attenuata TaxID=49451 RepID=UPI0009052996|nr:PREDICTED: uncharacterized protein LOC109231434 [Nicotiana attenuata]